MFDINRIAENRFFIFAVYQLHLLNMYFVIFLLFHAFFPANLASDVSGKVWGPGLQPNVLVLPARYLFLQLNKNLNELNETIAFKVDGVSVDGGRSCRVWSNVLDRQDGSYILRYKLYEPCLDLRINIQYRGEHIAASPYSFSGLTYSENCNCPSKPASEWLKEVQCGTVPEQITRDLGRFRSVDWTKIRSKIVKKYDNPGAMSLCHYVVKNNDVYRKCYGKYVGFKMFVDNVVLSLARKFRLPDLEFFFNLGDWPLVKNEKELYPIFSWCGSDDSFDILVPTYDITESTIENMGRVMLDMLSVQGNVAERWEDRIPKVFWRGRDSNENRLKLMDLAMEYKDLFNVSLTNFFFYKDQEKKYNKSEHVSFYRFFDYKYQVSIDGTVAAYRFPYLLAGGSLVFKQESKYYEHFYKDLVPYKHYVPIKTDLSDLIEKIKWAMGNDAEARMIAENGRAFANDRLLPKDVFCYHAHLFEQFSKSITSKVEVLDGMEKVEQPKEGLKCACDVVVKDEL